MPYDMEVGMYVIDSIQEIRDRLTHDLEQVSKSSILGESLTAMRAACRKFLTETQQPPKRARFYGMNALFWYALGELRGFFGIHISRIACAYDLEVEEQLQSILPAEPEEEGSEQAVAWKRSKLPP